MRDFVNSIDPFFFQLMLFPVTVIGLGVLAAIFIKKIIVGPVVTLVLVGSFELWDIGSLTSWCIILPLFSLLLSFICLSYVKPEEVSD